MKKLAVLWQDLPMIERQKYDAKAEVDKIRQGSPQTNRETIMTLTFVVVWMFHLPHDQ